MSDKIVAWVKHYTVNSDPLDPYSYSGTEQRISLELEGILTRENYSQWRTAITGRPITLNVDGESDGKIVEAVKELHGWLKQEEKNLEEEFSDDPEVSLAIGGIIEEMENKMAEIIKVKESQQQYERRPFLGYGPPLSAAQTYDEIASIADTIGYNIGDKDGEAE